tara:strand:- start:75 stop:1214 length:1140 start_codon:yes stop_codon:yes gene_type:complete
MSEKTTPRIKIPDTPKNKENGALPVWHHQQELILKRWSEIGSSYRYLHDKSFKKFNTQNMWFALPVIVISTVTGTANFAQGSFPDAWKEYVPLGIGFLNLSAGLITTVGQFLRVSELLEGHRAASLAYSKFARNISVELSLPVKERTDDGSIFITNCRFELDRLIEQSPDIPEDIISSFVKRFPEPGKDASGNPTNDYDFFRPEILDIRPIKIYRDKEAEIKRRAQIARLEAKKQADEESARLQKAMDERETERFKIIQETRKEFEKAQLKQNKEVNQMFELAQKRTQAEIVKNKFNVTNIEETMSDLLGSLNQAHNVVDDYTDSDNTSVSSLSPRNSITNTTTTLDTDETNEVVGNASEVEETTIENIEIIIEDISGN